MNKKLNIVGVGTALATTLATVSALCAVAFVVAPDSTLNFFTAFAHGFDLKAVKSAAPITVAGSLYGIIGLGAVGFVAGVVFASAYNATARR